MKGTDVLIRLANITIKVYIKTKSKGTPGGSRIPSEVGRTSDLHYVKGVSEHNNGLVKLSVFLAGGKDTTSRNISKDIM